MHQPDDFIFAAPSGAIGSRISRFTLAAMAAVCTMLFFLISDAGAEPLHDSARALHEGAALISQTALGERDMMIGALLLVFAGLLFLITKASSNWLSGMSRNPLDNPPHR